MTDESEDIEAILRRQDEALALLERLRRAQPIAVAPGKGGGGGRRDFRRWPTPEGITLELHDGERWHRAECLDIGIGGARLSRLPAWVEGPVPARLSASGAGAVLVLTDVMWRDGQSATTGLRFEFLDSEERDQWTGMLIDALLARYAVGQ